MNALLLYKGEFQCSLPYTVAIAPTADKALIMIGPATEDFMVDCVILPPYQQRPTFTMALNAVKAVEAGDTITVEAAIG